MDLARCLAIAARGDGDGPGFALNATSHVIKIRTRRTCATLATHTRPVRARAPPRGASSPRLAVVRAVL